MKKILFLLVLCTPIIAFCYDNNYSLKGNWREVSRKNSYNNYVRFKDTMKVEFLQSNECIWQEPNGYAYHCTYTIEPTGIDLGIRFFNILYNDGSYLVLGDEDGIYKFRRYKTNNNIARWSVRDFRAEQDNYHEFNSTRKIRTIQNDNDQPVYSSRKTTYWSVHNRAKNIKREETDYNRREIRDDEYYLKQPRNEDEYYPTEQRREQKIYPRRQRGELTGNWREVSRKNTNNKYINYRDTTFLDFLGNNEYVWHRLGSFIYRGTYIKDANGIDLGMRYFNIIRNEGNYLVVNDEVGTYEFEYYIPDADDPYIVKPEVFDPVNSIKQMAGHWSVFKRTSNYRPNEIDYTRQLKMVDFYSHQQDGGLGDFYSTRDADNAPSWYVEGYSRANQTVYLNGRDRREFHVIKCQDNELIMEEDGVTYFFRQFR